MTGDDERTAMQSYPYERFWQQLDEVHRTQPGKTYKVWPPEARPGSPVAPEYVYEAATMLCRATSPYRDWVLAHLDPVMAGHVRVGDDLELITLDPDLDVPPQVRAVRAAHRHAHGDEADASEAPLVTPNHLVSITPVNVCPADEPVPVAVDAQPWPPVVPDPSAGDRIHILVVDTGMVPDYVTDPDYLRRHPWLAKVDVLPDDIRAPFDPGSGLIKEYAGHGTFIAGVIGAVAAGATIRVSRALMNAGAMSEADFGQTLLRVLGDDDWPPIISLSAGAPTMDGLPLLGLGSFMAELDSRPDTVLIAAIGNDAMRDNAFDAADATSYHFWPAAYGAHFRSAEYRGTGRNVVSVGALARRHDGRACFSNHGSSVTVYARGEEHVNAFLSGEYEYHHGTDPACHNAGHYCPCSCVTSLPWHAHARFQGMARWSGTSFATPLVAGMVAAHMSRTGEQNAPRAARDLIAKSAQSVPHDDGEQLLAFL
jgi:subtilisin family serine protease